ncbi:BTAD domain-containing putative transcriptional regulator [Tissierella sp. Yu-01]|uniref:BTAD domain-containing putative transcriptional regulator n=1 Tax=Tissierella sp. Yu-01 TaxID=3035694 RepID=UPI00240D70C0|nr:BTAD domain-containing putative transcriptional regulator [Tissierella sp. Yu-01]WFA09080.1 BTAD domain-containing putative transcriptional regulator [Tissierella sp. Yu-01]
MVTINVKYLGIPSIKINNRIIELPFSKAESIIYALLYDKVFNREALCDLLWSDMDEQSAKKNLRNATYIIRKNTIDDLILSPKRSLLKINDYYDVISDVDVINNFNPCDIVNINSINQFLNVYDGLFLEDLKNKSTPGFEEWVEPRSAKINSTYFNKLKILCKELNDRKNMYLVEKCALKLIELEEYDETGYVYLMKSYIMQKRFEEAINTYTKLVKKLYNELSVKPSRETEKIYEDILKNVKLKTEVNSDSFYSRENEKKVVYDNVYNFVGNKNFVSLLICGEDGIGKSLFLNEVSKSLDLNILKLSINCYDYDKDFIFKFWDKIFIQISNYLSKHNINVPNGLVESISKTFPTLNVESNKGIDSYYSSSNYNITEKAIFDLFTLLTNKIKIIFFVDNIHFVDKASKQLLCKTILANRYKIMLIATKRAEKEDINDKFFFSLKCNNVIEKIELKRFNKSETKKFLELILPGISFDLDKIYAESEGNPLFILEMGNAIKNGNQDCYMTNKIENLIEARLMHLSDQAIKILSICSLFHGVFNIETLSNITNINSIELIDLIDELLTKGILKEDFTDENKVILRFTHRKIREYIYNNISNSKRLILHEKLGEYYEDKLNDNLKNNRTLFPEVIYHYSYSNNKLKLFRYKIRRLDYMLDARHEIFPVAEVSEAVNLFKSYIDDESLEEEFNTIKSIYNELACSKKDLIEEFIVYLYLYGRFNKGRWNNSDGLISLNKMVRLSEENNYYEHALNGYLQLIHFYVNNRDLPSMIKAIDKAENIANKINDESKLAIIFRFKGYYNILSRNYEEGEKYLSHAIKIFSSSGNKEKYVLNIVAALFYLGESKRLQGLYEEAMGYYNNAIELCDENEDFPAAALIFSKIGYVRYQLNFIDEAQFYFLKSIKAYEKSIFVWGRAEVYYYLYKIYKEKNNMAKATMYYEQALKFVDKYSSDDIEIINATK